MLLSPYFLVVVVLFIGETSLILIINPFNTQIRSSFPSLNRMPSNCCWIIVIFLQWPQGFVPPDGRFTKARGFKEEDGRNLMHPLTRYLQSKK